MIDIQVPLLLCVIFLLFAIFIKQREILTILFYGIMSAMCAYAGFNVEDRFISILLIAFSVISVLMIPISLILIYIKKLRTR